jgi:hypothetical protein
MFELIFGLLVVTAMLGSLAFLSWVAVQFNVDFLVPFIFSSPFWLMAVVNFQDKVNRNTRAERIGALIRAVCMTAVTVPLFVDDLPHPIYFSFGTMIVMAVGCGILEGLPALMQKNPPPESHTSDSQLVQQSREAERFEK